MLPGQGERLGIAVVGLGRAGRARVRALEAHPRARLCAAVRSATDARGAATSVRLEDVLQDPDVKAVLVCTPNLLHAAAVRRTLEAGKHVGVEFPLAEGPETARKLFALAARSGRVLHVEHIELLSSSQRAQRERAGRLGRPTGGALHFTGGIDGWIGDERLAGSPALRAVARLHRLVDLFGEIERTHASLERGRDGRYRLEADLAFEHGGCTRLIEERGPGLPRGLRWDVECEHGRLDMPPPGPAGALFRADLDHFLDRIESGRPPYVSEARILHVLERVAAMEAAAEGGAPA